MIIRPFVILKLDSFVSCCLRLSHISVVNLVYNSDTRRYICNLLSFPPGKLKSSMMVEGRGMEKKITWQIMLKLVSKRLSSVQDSPILITYSGLFWRKLCVWMVSCTLGTWMLVKIVWLCIFCSGKHKLVGILLLSAPMLVVVSTLVSLFIDRLHG